MPSLRILSFLSAPTLPCRYPGTALLTDSWLVTADRRLFEAGRRKAPLRSRVLWVEDIPA